MENNDTLEVIQRIPLDKLRPYPDHPFGVRDDDMMQQTVESIKHFGVLVPGIARPLPDGAFELIAGHRRKQPSAVAGLDDMPIIVRDIDRNATTIIMVDSNLQRENILPSEKAKAYKMKLEAIKRQAGRPGKNSAQVGQNFEGKTSRAQIAENSPDSSSQIQRYIRLNELEPELLQLVDEGKIVMTPAVEISYLTPDEQRLLIETIDSEQATPSFSQAQRMSNGKRCSRYGEQTRCRHQSNYYDPKGSDSMKAIAVDDEIYMLETLQEAVSASSDIEMVEAFSSCSAALTYATENPVDIAFLDINMRGIGGLGLAEKLIELQPRCKIVFCTGYQEYAVSAFQLHVSGYLMKPITPEAVQKEIDHASYFPGALIHRQMAEKMMCLLRRRLL